MVKGTLGVGVATEIVDGLIVNADVNAGADIDESKLEFDASGHEHKGGTDGNLIPTAGIENQAIDDQKIKSDAVRTVHILNAQVTEPKIALGAVDAPKIATNAVTEAKINAGAVTVNKLATDAVETLKIKDANVTLDKLALNSVDSSKIVNDSILNEDVKTSAAIDFSKINVPNLAVLRAMLANGIIDTTKLNAGAVATAKLDYNGGAAPTTNEEFHIIQVNNADVNLFEHTKTFTIPNPPTDEEFWGIDSKFTAGENIAKYEVVYLVDDGKVWRSDADGLLLDAIGIATEAITAESVGKILLYGRVRNDAWDWSAGAKIYLSDTAGALTETPPTGIKQQLAIAINADQIFFNPQAREIRYVTRGDPASVDWTEADLTEDATWRELDISSVVPAGAIRVKLSVQMKNTASSNIVGMFRDASASNAIVRSGCVVKFVNNYYYRNPELMVNAITAIIDYYFSTSANWEIDITVQGWWI